MIKNKTIICISHTTWEGEYTKSTVQLLSLLARYNQVIFIEYPRTFKDLIFGILGKVKVPVRQMLGFSSRITTKETSCNTSVQHVVLPPMLPVDFLKNNTIQKLFLRYNFWVYKKMLTRVAATKDPNEILVLTAYNPRYGLGLLHVLNEFLHVYYCYDGMDETTHHISTIKAEKTFCERVDAIITTSDYLKVCKGQWNANTYVVKNGVDMQIFSKAKIDTKTNSNDKQIIGYVGTLDFRFDVALVAYAATVLQDVIFEFTGHVSNPNIIKALSGFDNIHFRKAIPAASVPNYMSRFALGIIPYLQLEVNKNIYPLKINEYLAMGLPVVMTDFATLPEFENHVMVSQTKEQFVCQLQIQLKANSSEAISRRIAFASKNSWEERTKLFGSILQQLWKEKQTLQILKL
ncbi:MAG: glycosyltransferase [Flavobacteriaceae bacterium]|nr:glycosyltransferase [Flavobacteriaceae bacterium]